MNRYLSWFCCLLLSQTVCAQSLDELKQREEELSIECAELELSGDSVRYLECLEKRISYLREHLNLLRSQNLENIDSVFYSKRKHRVTDKNREQYESKKELKKDVFSYAGLGDSCVSEKDTVAAILYYIKADSIAEEYMPYLSDYEVETMANVNYILGVLCYNGNGTATDHKRGVYHILRAAYLDHADAQNLMGKFSLFETELPRRLFLPYWYIENNRQVNAKYWFEKAADNGNIDAQRELAFYNYEEENPDNVIRYGTKEGCRDSADIQSIVGWAYYVKSDYENAGLWLNKAAEQNNAYACWVLSCMNDFVLNNPTDYFKYLKKAADLEYPDALHDMGINYLDGNIVEKDFNIALGYFQQAANKGCLKAWETMGTIYYMRQYGHVDYSKAASYWKQGVEAGSVECQYNYGYLLKKGKGVKKNKEESIKWFKIAAQNGSENAKEELRKMKVNIEDVITESDCP